MDLHSLDVLVRLIRDVGFPIVVALMLLLLVRTELRDMRQVLESIRVRMDAREDH